MALPRADPAGWPARERGPTSPPPVKRYCGTVTSRLSRSTCISTALSGRGQRLRSLVLSPARGSAQLDPRSVAMREDELLLAFAVPCPCRAASFAPAAAHRRTSRRGG